MARDKAKDDLLFNCTQDYELDQVASHYGSNKTAVKLLLQDACKKGEIKNFKHTQVYNYIKEKKGYPIPV